MKIVFAVWKINKETEDIISRLTKYISTKLGEIQATTIDVATYDPGELTEPCFALGELAYKNIASEYRWKLPSPRKLVSNTQNIQHRKRAQQVIDAACARIQNINGSHTESETMCVETPEGITVGQQNTDIQITQEELNYIKQLKHLLAGSKVIVQKGELRVEIF